jgi:hypothetical protein
MRPWYRALRSKHPYKGRRLSAETSGEKGEVARCRLRCRMPRRRLPPGCGVGVGVVAEGLPSLSRCVVLKPKTRQLQILNRTAYFRTRLAFVSPLRRPQTAGESRGGNLLMMNLGES